jgi:hypothetical protein
VLRKLQQGAWQKESLPLEEGSERVKAPVGRLAAERPLLLNPFKQPPADHLGFVDERGGLKFGELRGLTAIGETSIKIYNLNRGDLVKARRDAYQLTLDRLKGAETAPQIKASILRQLLAGKSEYSIVVRAAVARWLEQQEEKEHATERAELAEARAARARARESQLRAKAIAKERKQLLSVAS